MTGDCGARSQPHAILRGNSRWFQVDAYAERSDSKWTGNWEKRDFATAIFVAVRMDQLSLRMFQFLSSGIGWLRDAIPFANSSRPLAVSARFALTAVPLFTGALPVIPHQFAFASAHSTRTRCRGWPRMFGRDRNRDGTKSTMSFPSLKPVCGASG